MSGTENNLDDLFILTPYWRKRRFAPNDLSEPAIPPPPTLGPNWTQLKGNGFFNGNVLLRTETQPYDLIPEAAVHCGAFWNANAFPADQSSRITISAFAFPAAGGVDQMGPAVRVNSNGSMYFTFFQVVQSTGAILLYLWKFITNTISVGLLPPLPMPGIAIGDQLELRVQGTTLSTYYNGNLMLTVTDSAINSGQPGIYMEKATSARAVTRMNGWSALALGATNAGELISYQQANLTAAFKYNIGTRIRRGVAGSPISAHLIGSNFLRLDENVSEWDYDAKIIGQSVFAKFTSFNLRGMQEENIANVPAYPLQITGASLGLLTPAHATYKPTSNPLTGHDAGGSATANIAGFLMRIPGITDIIVNSGSISGLPYNTLCYIYYDDPGLIGGNVIFQATTTKEVALNVAGRLFIGSILTPVAGGPDTVGNGDGGGAQIGMVDISRPSILDPIVQVGTGVASNPYNAIDGDQSSFAEFDATGNNADNTAEMDIHAPPGLARAYQSSVLKVWYSVPTNSVTGGIGTIAVAFISWVLGPGVVGNLLVQVMDNGATIPGINLAQVTLPQGANLSQLVVEVAAGTAAGHPSGMVSLLIYDIRIDSIS